MIIDKPLTNQQIAVILRQYSNSFKESILIDFYTLLKLSGTS